MLLPCVDFVCRKFGCSREVAVSSFLPCRLKEFPDDVLFAYSRDYFKFADKIFYSYQKDNYFFVFFDGKRNHFYKCINDDLEVI